MTGLVPAHNLCDSPKVGLYEVLSALDVSPCYDPVSHLVHAVGRDAVTDVWIAGRRVVSDRALITADEAAIAARARAWQERLQ